MSAEKPASDVNTSLIARIRSGILLVLTATLLWLVWQNAVTPDSDRPFKLGLDLAGGSQLVYEADVTNIDPLEVSDLMDTLRTVIERRVNSLGTEENSVYVEQSSAVAGDIRHRLVIELPGVTDVSEAAAEIGRTPLLEFKLLNREIAQQEQAVLAELSATTSTTSQEDIEALLANLPNPYIDTELTGRYLESAALEFTSGQSGMTGEPVVSIRFNSEGADLFASITRANVGEQLAIFLDGEPISQPRINEAIVGGTAIISGGFTAPDARALAQNLNLGALPVPIELVNTQTIGATLGSEVLEQGMVAGLIGFIILSLFMIAYYRLSGFVAVIALITYVTVMLAIFQWLPVTLTAAGLAGFILSIGIAVDANVLVFERLKEELRKSLTYDEAVRAGFSRAWSAIRDGNITSIISAVILFWFGTSLVKGFALVFGIGVIISMLSAILVTRTFLLALPTRFATEKYQQLMFGIKAENNKS